jgi:hypothetical protein
MNEFEERMMKLEFFSVIDKHKTTKHLSTEKKSLLVEKCFDFYLNNNRKMKMKEFQEMMKSVDCGMKRLTIAEYRAMGFQNMCGHIVEFDEPLTALFFEDDKKTIIDGKVTETFSMFPKYQSKEAIVKFMMVTGGFGATFGLMGRMLIGTFYLTYQDAVMDKKIEAPKGCHTGGNTKVYPSWIYIKEDEKVMKE